MLSSDNCVHHNSGTFTGTSGSASLDGADVTEAGNIVVLFVYSVGNGGITTPTGFVLDAPTAAQTDTTHRIYIFRRGPAQGLAAGESSWTVNASASLLVTWAVREYTGIDLNSPNAGVSTLSLGTGVGNRQLSYSVGSGETVAVGFWGAFDSGATAPTMGLNDLTSPIATAVDTTSGTGGGNAAAILVAEEFPTGTGGYTATINGTRSPTGSMAAVGTSYRAKGSALYPTLTHILGAQHGTSAGWTTGNTGYTYLASASAGVSVTSTNPRHHTYCFLASATSAACNFTGSAATVAGGVFVGRFSFRLNSTPAADLELGGVVGFVTFRYVQASQKIGCKVGTGTEQLSTATVSSGNWYSVNYRLDTSTSANQCEWSWRIDSTTTLTTETTATATGAANTSFTPRLGWTTATTGSVNLADLVCSSTSAAYPLGDYQVRAATVNQIIDPGVTADFNVFSNNGTMAAWNNATALAAVSELPATIGASANGLAQVTASSTTLDLYFGLPSGIAPTGTGKGARFCVVGWAASGTSATLKFNYAAGGSSGTFDGGTTAVDWNFDNSTTAPGWACSAVVATGTTSTALTSTAWTSNPPFLRVGDSGDATPDMGLHAAYVEVAVKVEPPLVLMRGPDGNAMATLYQDSNTSGYISLTFTAPSDRGMSYSYEYPAGTTNGPTTLAAGASSSAITLDASVLTSTPRVNCTLDPAP